MIPATAESRAAWEQRAEIAQGESVEIIGEHGPAFVEQRRAAGREARLKDQVEGIDAGVVGDACGGDGEEGRVGDSEKVFRCEAIGGIQDVGLAPADELLAEFGGEFALSQRGVELAEGKSRTAQRTILP